MCKSKIFAGVGFAMAMFAKIQTSSLETTMSM
jgi:hypothetical protein